MSEPIEVARVEIVRSIGDDGDTLSVRAVVNGGDTLPLLEALGMLRLAEDTVIRDAMGEVPDDEDDD